MTKILKKHEREALLAAREEASKFGATVEIDTWGGGHSRLIVNREGKTRKIALSRTPTNVDSCIFETVRSIRRTCAELSSSTAAAAVTQGAQMKTPFPDVKIATRKIKLRALNFSEVNRKDKSVDLKDAKAMTVAEGHAKVEPTRYIIEPTACVPPVLPEEQSEVQPKMQPEVQPARREEMRKIRTSKDIIAINDLLRLHLVETGDKWKYVEDWTDQKVADAVGVSLTIVQSIRRENFGDLKPDLRGNSFNFAGSGAKSRIEALEAQVEMLRRRDLEKEEFLLSLDLGYKRGL